MTTLSPFVLGALLAFFEVASLFAADPAFRIDKETERIVIYRTGSKEPILVQMAQPDFRPYLHPLVAPDGKGLLTEFSPKHHTHQTGLFVGHTRINGRDYFHNPGKEYFRRLTHDVGKPEIKRVSWKVVYDLLGKDGVILTETQQWVLIDDQPDLILDLEWTAAAKTDVTVGKYEYGGLFLRMPWKGSTGGNAINSEGQQNGKAEGQRARWVDVGMPIEGRAKDDWGHIVIMDHPANVSHPTPWRVDGQLGVGPARARLGDWTIAKGQQASAKYRFFIYTGTSNGQKVEKAWKKFIGK